MLSDGHAVYTPGQSENRAGAISYPAFDRIGNLWTQDASGQRQLFYEDTTGFGSLTALGGSNASPFKFGGANGCQMDADTGLVLMGYRYFDPRLGRFITQDPIHSGNNWYAYCENSPINAIDPSGLDGALVGTLNLSGSWSRNDIETYVGLHYDDGTYSVSQNGKPLYTFTINTMQNVGGFMMHVPPNQDFNSTLAAVRNFNHNTNTAKAALVAHPPAGMLKAQLSALLDAQKLIWYLKHFGYNTIGDPKHWNHKFENYGNFEAGAAAAAGGYSLGTYLEGVQAIHIGAHTLNGDILMGRSPVFESMDMTEMGYGYYLGRYGNQ